LVSFLKLKWVWACEVSRVLTISIVCAWKKLNVCLRGFQRREVIMWWVWGWWSM
jgi:hypothetical protein